MGANRKDGGPAFPLENPRQLENGDLFRQFPGMSLRDWFAGQALQGLIASGHRPYSTGPIEQSVAAAAYASADAMLAVREGK